MKLPDFRYQCGDALEFMADMPDNSVKLILTSPPYNMGKAYEARTSIDEYLDNMRPALSEMRRILAEGGSICWQTGNYVEKGEVFPLDMYYYPMFKRLGFHLRNRIIWHFGHGLHFDTPHGESRGILPGVVVRDSCFIDPLLQEKSDTDFHRRMRLLAVRDCPALP